MAYNGLITQPMTQAAINSAASILLQRISEVRTKLNQLKNARQIDTPEYKKMDADLHLLKARHGSLLLKEPIFEGQGSLTQN